MKNNQENLFINKKNCKINLNTNLKLITDYMKSQSKTSRREHIYLDLIMCLNIIHLFQKVVPKYSKDS